MNNIQKEVQEFNVNNDLQLDVASRVMDISSEVGELAKEVLLGTGYGKRELVLTDNFENELGDVLYSLISLSNEANIDLNKCLFNTMRKINNRL